MPAPLVAAGVVMAASKWLSVAHDALEVFGFVRDSAGAIVDRVTVRVAGNPRATNNQLFRVAAATAFGIAKQLTPIALISPGSIKVEYDAAGNQVSFQVIWIRSMTTSTFGGLKPGNVTGQAVFNGPPDTFVGDTFDFVSGPRVPLIPRATGLNLAAEAGRVILTKARSVNDPNPAGARPGNVIQTPNPRPSGDARSRGSLAFLVYQTLASNPDTTTHGYPLPFDGPVVTRFSGN